MTGITTAGYSEPCDFIQFIKFVGHNAFVKGDAEGAFAHVHKADAPHVAVKNVLVVVVAYLHDLVVQAEATVATAHFYAVGVQGFLQTGVHAASAHSALVHGREHLDVVHRIEVEAPGNVVTHEIHNELRCLFRIILVDKVEVREPILARFQRRNFTTVDEVGIADDFALR